MMNALKSLCPCVSKKESACDPTAVSENESEDCEAIAQLGTSPLSSRALDIADVEGSSLSQEQKNFSSTQGDLTKDEVKLVQTTWAQVESEAFGVSLFTELFNAHPEYSAFFGGIFLTRDDDKDLFQNARFRQHIASRVTAAVGRMLDNLEKPKSLSEQLVKLGQKHRARGVTRHDFQNLKPLFIVTLKNLLGSSFTPPAHVAWSKTLDTAFNILFTGLEG